MKTFTTVDELEAFILKHGENIVDLMGGKFIIALMDWYPEKNPKSNEKKKQRKIDVSFRYQ